MRPRAGFISLPFAALCCMGAAAEPRGAVVHSAFGGQIFGFDIDRNGTEGVLSEAGDLHGGKVLAAIETFSQTTGAILKIVRKTQTKDDFLTLGVVGGSIGLVEHEHVHGIYVTRRSYPELAPLGANAITGTWLTKLQADDLVLGISRGQNQRNTAVLAYHNKGAGRSFVFGATIGAGSAGPFIALHNPAFGICCGPAVAYDSITNQAVVAASTGAVGGPPPVFALADLATGKVTQFDGLPGAPPYRAGFINGLAVDADDGIACTTTELDFKVEFYDLQRHTGFAVVLPGAGNQLQSGSDVQFDPANKLFLVAQSVSSTARSGSSIQVYDIKGNLVESLNGFSFSNVSNVVSTHIALNPATRVGYVDGPDARVRELQSFTY